MGSWKSFFCHIYCYVWLYFAYQAFGVVVGTSVPFSVVLTESMLPQIQRGDILFAVSPSQIGVGDIVLYQLPHRSEIPIVHRVTKIYEDGSLMTKG